MAARAPSALFVHTVGCLEAIRRKSGCEPMAFTTSAPNSELKNGLVFCRVDSWLTGRRLVSLPFSDHCEPLVDSPAELQAILSAVTQLANQDKLRYVEFRPLRKLDPPVTLFRPSSTFCFHQLDLAPSLDTLLHN